jgi:hypothetical protein
MVLTMSKYEHNTPRFEGKLTINASALEPYRKAGFILIPLKGKRPLHPGWTTQNYSTGNVIKLCTAQNRNAGMRIPSDVVVFDFDPRNGATDEAITDFCMEFGIDVLANPWCVRTGGNGWHSYYRLPPDVHIASGLKEWPGIEFKSAGHQVVAAGSIHPETGNHYVWANGPPSGDIPELPEGMLAAITRPESVAVSSGSGQLDVGQLAKALARLDPLDFNTNEKWEPLMMSAHHVTNGDGREEFIAWCKGDPKFREDEKIGLRWDSCRNDKSCTRGIGTLRKILADAGALDALPPDREEAAADFDGTDDSDFDAPSEDGWMDGPFVDDVPIESRFTEESESVLAALNNKHCAVFSEGNYRIMHREGGTRWAAASKADFISRYENQSVENSKEGRGVAKTISLGKAWQEWPGRKTADGTTFDPRSEPAAIVNGSLNLWSGYAVQPKAGSCAHFLNMIRDDLCDGIDDVFRYVLNWTAWKLQNPGLLPQTALAFVGPKGTGKTTYGETLATIFGEHGMVADDIDQIAGRFNGHLETKCFVYADEAVWGGDKSNESALKKLITDKKGSYEYKGMDIFDGPNHVGLVLAGNDKWIVPASIDERRFCVSQVSGKHRVSDDASPDHPSRLYWNRLYHELDNGGRAAFLYAMLNRDLGDWHPRTGIPRTKAMGEQKLHGLTGVSKWWFEVLRDGLLPDVRTDSEEADWSTPYVSEHPDEHINARHSPLRKLTSAPPRLPGTILNGGSR